MAYRLLPVPILLGILSSCTSQTPAPVVTPMTPSIPSANWRDLGVTLNGNVLNEIDNLSIKRRGDLVEFRDRKTIFDPKKESFLDTPQHKISINTWQIDCQAQTYKLLAMLLFDEDGHQVANFNYNDNQIKSMPIVKNSASYQQMLYVCLGQGSEVKGQALEKRSM